MTRDSAARRSAKPDAPDARAETEVSFTRAEEVHAARIVDIAGPLVPALASALGPRTEVVLHDLTRMPMTIAAIGGAITGRSVGGPPTDLGLRTFRSGWRDHLIGYRTETPDGLIMRSSSLFFHAPSGKPVACLCINADVSALVRAQEMLGALTALSPEAETSAKTTEHFPLSVEKLIEDILRDAIAAVGVPLHLMKKSHKVEVVRELEERGFFTIRDAVDTAANHLGVSRYSIYNYLNELQSSPEEGTA